MQKLLDKRSIEKACEIFLANRDVRYICIIDKMGNLLFEKEQSGKNLLVSNLESRSLYIKSVLEILFDKDFDSQIGVLRYNVSHRTKVDLITIPIYGHVVLISVEPMINSDLIANSAIKVFEKILEN
jgi:hypothetical protein